MTYTDTIPTLVIETVRSIYKPLMFEDYQTATANVFDGWNVGPRIADVTLVLSQLAIVLSVALAAFIVFVALQRRALKAQSTESDVSPTTGGVASAAVPAGVLRDRWNTIVSHLDSVKESDWKHAVMEADKLVDDSLARAGFAGATFGDRLSNIQPGALLSLDGVWWAHKIRNRLAHEIDYFLRYTEARQAVGYYEAALAELNLI